MTEYSTFSRRLAEAIARSGRKKGDVARAIPVAPITLSRWLSGSVMPREPVIAALARELRVDPHWLRGAPRVGAAPADPERAFHTFVAETTPDYAATLMEQLASLDDAEREALERFLRGLKSGDAEIRRHLIGQMKIIERAVEGPAERADEHTA
jgi:transcriptional regulator with XRE-family HTH domain